MRTNVCKYLLVMLAMFFVQTTYGQRNVKQFVAEYSKKNSVECVNLNSFLMKVGSLFAETYGVKHIDVFSLSNCKEEDKQSFHKAMRDLKDKRYETVVSTGDDSGRTKVMVRFKKDFVEEVVVLTSGKSPAIVRVQGKIKPSDIQKITSKHTDGGR